MEKLLSFPAILYLKSELSLGNVLEGRGEDCEIASPLGFALENLVYRFPLLRGRFLGRVQLECPIPLVYSLGP